MHGRHGQDGDCKQQTVAGPSLTKVDTGEWDSHSLVTGGAYGRGVHAKSFATQDA